MATATMEPRLAKTELTARSARRELARRHFRAFVEHFPPARPYHWGRHTVAIAQGLEAAHRGYLAGESQFDIWCCPFRHGKSDLVSRRFPIWHLGACPDDEIILATYGFVLARKMSRDARRVFRSDEYRHLYGLTLDRAAHAAGEWQVEGHRGGLVAVGLEGASGGRGAHLLVIDDYLKSRAEAESETERDNVWDAFANDLMTRRAPVSMVEIVANRWHEDDLVGRILRAMETDPAFPRFRLHVFPAWDAARGGWLFPERFSAQWYEGQQAALGSYAAAAMFQQEPTPRTGRMLRTDRVDYYDVAPEGLRRVRFWDLASTEKERTKNDPDFTVGVLLGARRDDRDAWHVYIDDVERGQWEAPERDRRIVATAEADGPGVRVGIESVAGYKDTYTRMKALLAGKAVVEEITVSRDKVVRAEPLEPVFEAGHVHLRRAHWNGEYLRVMGGFPGGKHDDDADATSGGFHMVLDAQGADVRVA